MAPSMMEAEQYFSAESFTARSTCFSDRPRPVTMKCTWMRVNTLGSVSARSASISTSQPVMVWRERCRIMTTSKLVQPPMPSSSISMGRGPRLRPPASGGPSMTTEWPLPDSPTKLM